MRYVPRRGARRVALDAWKLTGLTSTARVASSTPRSGSCLLCGRLVERHQVAISASVTGRRYASAAGVETCARACRPSCARLDCTRRAAAARRFGHAGGIERTGDGDVLDVRQTEMIGRDQRAALKILQAIRPLRGVLHQEGRAHGPLPRLHLHAHLQPLGQRVHYVGGIERGLRVVIRPADRREQDSLTIYGHLELMLVLQAADRAEVDLEELDLDHVFAVERKRVQRHQTAARPWWQRVVLACLRCVTANAVGLRSRDDLGSPTPTH